jgi:glucokinase
MTTSDCAYGTVVGLDIGGTFIKSALVGPDGVPLGVERWPTGRQRGPEAVMATVLECAAQRVAAASERGESVRAVGVASCGLVNEMAGIGVFSAALGWHDMPLRQLMKDRLGLPVALGHDVRAGGLAEARLGAGRGHDVFLFLPLGTGVGAALVINGRPFVGGHWRAVELGHVVARPGGDACSCGQRGCLDTLAGGPAIVRRYRMLANTPAGSDPEVLDAATLDAAEVARRAAEEDPAAMQVWATAVDALADTLTTAVTLFDPSAVVVGGGLGRSGELLLGPLREGVARRLSFQAMPEIVAAQLGDEAGCVGAGLLAWDLLRLP